MSRRTERDTASLDLSVEIAAPPARVLSAFFDRAALAAWWRVTNAVVTPRPLGVFAVEFPTTEYRDEILGRLGGVFYGTVVQFQEADGFFVANAYWIPPDSEPIGPMAFEVRCTLLADGPAPRTQLRVTQNGFEESRRWRRYYEVIGTGWDHALSSLQGLLEHD